MQIPKRPPTLEQVLQKVDRDGLMEAVLNAGPVDPKGRYLHWDQMRRRTPPPGLSHEAWWLATHVSRQSMSRNLPLLDVNGQPFRFSNVDLVQEMVHKIDQQASGQILADGVVDPRSSDRYLVSSLIEEAITSSQLEGASTTRRVAKEMLATGRPPRDRDEQMILNNYRAMLLAQDMAEGELTPTGVLDLHRVVTEGTLDDPADAGKLQQPDDDRIKVMDLYDNVLHDPPPAEQLPGRLEAMCAFANEGNSDGFIHPVVRAIILHLWLAYDHPFVDGNGRTARALFYWSLLHDGYWLAQYLSVSSILRKAPAKYARSYLYTETDGNDATYFLIYQLEVILRAIKSLHEYLARKILEVREIETLLRGSALLNHRQMAAVSKALRNQSERFTISAHMHLHGVVYQSARSDLLGLADLGLLLKERAGKQFVFLVPHDLPARLRCLGATAAAS